MYPFDYLVFIGRFQPFHVAHQQTIHIALAQAERVIIALGSAQNERTLKNPFLADERKQMILSNFSVDEQQRIIFVDVIDVYNDVKWQALVRQLVQNITQADDKIGLIGYNKDESTYYLDLFPEWQRVVIDSLHGDISATPLREAYYNGQILSDKFPQGTVAFLQKFQKNAIYQQLQTEFLAKTHIN